VTFVNVGNIGLCVCIAVPRLPVRHVSSRLAYYDNYEIIRCFIVVVLLTAAAYRWFVGFDFSNFFCLFVFYFICIIYIFTYHGDVLDETTNTESDLGSASRDNDQYYYINIVLLIGRHGELVG